MTKYRKKCSIWAEKTYAETLKDLKEVPPKLRKAANKCFEDLELSTKTVNGYSCEGLPKTQEGSLGIKINYTNVFHSLIRKNKFTPVNYLIELIKRFHENRGSDSKINGFIARGIRTLTSLLREPDFAELLYASLHPLDRRISVHLNPTQDAGDHTDILLNFRKRTYRIWLFQFSDRGLPHDIERVSGKRGDLPRGIHILCPLHTEIALKSKILENRLARKKKQIDRHNNLLARCSNRTSRTGRIIQRRLDTLNEQAIDIATEYKRAKSASDKELDVVEGWFFYSPSHVERIAKLISSNPKPHQYKKVVKILLSPEKFLKEVRIFKIS